MILLFVKEKYPRLVAIQPRGANFVVGLRVWVPLDFQAESKSAEGATLD